MKKIILVAICACFGLAAMAQHNDGTYTKVGDQVPNFTFQLEKAKTTSIEAYKGKLVLINLFATWCPPCNEELPRAQKEIWDKYKNNKNFAFFVFGREQGWDVLTPYKQKKGFTFPILPDADRAIFSKFAKQSIPRNILVDEDGRIIYQSIGYSADEFDGLLKLISKNLDKTSTK
ncbi:peroxiredoxin [Pedobacter sp. UYP30]|uniref:TlpA family protein disulfide reductase n=1 Tax=Pedobacter sp. UYP30 TaxID=1756400 RepID=UPI0033932F53